MGTLMLASHLQVPPAVPSFEWFEIDKLAHLLLYGLLATLWFRALKREGRSRRRLALAFGLTIGFGMVDEVIQSFNAYRYFSLADWVADAVGALVALACYIAWPAYRRLLEQKLIRRRPAPTA